MPPVKGGIEGEFEGRVYPFVLGLKSGPKTLHLCGEGTTYDNKDGWVTVREPDGSGGENYVRVPLDNVAFIAHPMFLIVDPPK